MISSTVHSIRPRAGGSTSPLLKRSTLNVNWFVWPELCDEEPGIAWIDEGMFHFLIRLSANPSIAYLPYIYFQSSRGQYDFFRSLKLLGVLKVRCMYIFLEL